MSSLGSSEQPHQQQQQPPRTSFDFGAKRWSRQGVLLKRLTPPSGSPPATLPSGPTPLPPSSPNRGSSFKQQRHPYAAESPPSPSRSPSQRSTHSPHSIMTSFQNVSKRASGSSVRSDSTYRKHDPKSRWKQLPWTRAHSTTTFLRACSHCSPEAIASCVRTAASAAGA